MARERSNGTQFPRTTGRKRGYRTDAVDDFLHRVRDTYEGRTAPDRAIRAFHIRQTAFPLVRKGYEPRYVDAALDRLEEVMFERERQAYIRDHGQQAWESLVAELQRDLLGRIHRQRDERFRKRSLLAHGYRPSQVDAVVEQLEEVIRDDHRVRTNDIRQLRFHSQRGGYCEAQVDAFLDSVVEYLLARR